MLASQSISRYLTVTHINLGDKSYSSQSQENMQHTYVGGLLIEKCACMHAQAYMCACMPLTDLEAEFPTYMLEIFKSEWGHISSV